MSKREKEEREKGTVTLREVRERCLVKTVNGDLVEEGL